jgi:hypothetical protein
MVIVFPPDQKLTMAKPGTPGQFMAKNDKRKKPVIQMNADKCG